MWSGHKIYTTIFTGTIALLVASPFKGWSGWREVLLTLGFSCLVFLALLGIGFLAFLVWAPADMHRQANRQIAQLKLEKDDLSFPAYGMLSRRKVIENLEGCNLDALRLIKYLYVSGGHLLEHDLINRFGIEALRNAQKTRLLDRRETRLTSANLDPVQTNVYSISKEYKTMLGDILTERENV